MKLMTALLFLLNLPLSSNAKSLPRLSIDRNLITVSGLSSGAFMAEQMLVAFSGTIQGAALFAGGPYYCAEGQIAKALTLCMNNPSMVDTEALARYAVETEKEGGIDSLKNLDKSRLYIFASPTDSVVKKGSGELIKDLMKRWIPETNIRLTETPLAEHGIPTLNFGNPCEKLGSPYLQSCKFDGIGTALQYLYKNQLKPARELTPNEKLGLKTFDQSKTSERGSGLSNEGWVFIPPSCGFGVKCPLHIAFHGCSQNFESVGKVFIENAGYLQWAVANDIVVLFPQTLKSAQNPKGCWDWFGYTGPQYATRSGPQMKSIYAFIRELTGP